MAADPFDPVLLVSPLSSQPRLIDTIFNVSSLTSGIFNNSLFQYAGIVIVGIILLGKIIIIEIKIISKLHLLKICFNLLIQAGHHKWLFFTV